MELGDGARLAGARVLEVDRAHQVVVAPDVLAHKMNLEIMLVS